ncbi:hypothetical protein [Oceanicola sp. 502str15]|uniref:hypothetical protein n=1 Tax=Oceanicola sp. 502str15 TaxID=2696061 RepID=UPI002094F7D1|nr:hypothetical protein [Oceanicola sp. 502str15]MCO6384164.1 hypothetical protein [Oceanicola sp. 502str15]
MTRLAAFLLTTTPATAQNVTPEWTARKCELYEMAFADALSIQGPSGLRESFLAENDAFVATGCSTRQSVCAETPEEVALANLLTVMTMNEGMASTFVPFGCAP